jgi:hypothetical protein
VAAIDKQIAVHQKREFAEQAKVIAYFEQARDILLRMRAAGGLDPNAAGAATGRANAR